MLGCAPQRGCTGMGWRGWAAEESWNLRRCGVAADPGFLPLPTEQVWGKLLFYGLAFEPFGPIVNMMFQVRQPRKDRTRCTHASFAATHPLCPGPLSGALLAGTLRLPRCLRLRPARVPASLSMALVGVAVSYARRSSAPFGSS
jgi:hypothetical protein